VVWPGNEIRVVSHVVELLSIQIRVHNNFNPPHIEVLPHIGSVMREWKSPLEA
jgi:hypothetical protein